MQYHTDTLIMHSNNQTNEYLLAMLVNKLTLLTDIDNSGQQYDI